MHQKHNNLMQDSQHTHALANWRGTTAIIHALSVHQPVRVLFWTNWKQCVPKRHQLSFMEVGLSHTSPPPFGAPTDRCRTRRCSMALRLQAVIRARLGRSNGATGLWRLWTKMSLNGLCRVFKSYSQTSNLNQINASPNSKHPRSLVLRARATSMKISLMQHRYVIRKDRHTRPGEPKSSLLRLGRPLQLWKSAWGMGRRLQRMSQTCLKVKQHEISCL